MKTAAQLKIGERFRLVTETMSLNQLTIGPDAVLKTDRLYAVPPYVVVAHVIKGPKIVTLLPNTPVRGVKEPVTFFIPPEHCPRAVAFRLLWDGTTDISSIVEPQALAIIKTLHATGRTEFAAEELRCVLDEKFSRFWPTKLKRRPRQVFNFCRRYLVNCGLLEEIL